MITSAERAHILAHAYVPEHLPHYVTAIARTEPFLIGDFVVHVSRAQLILVGYPLDENFDATRMLDVLTRARARFKPRSVSILAPALSATLRDCTPLPPDEYYRLDVTTLAIPQKTRNMLTRARREVSTRAGKFGKEHQRLVEEFLRVHRLDDATRAIFERVHEYARCATVVVLEARDAHDNLIAFDLADFGAAQYAFYMFNFRAMRYNVPGASDLLLAHIIERARAEGKCYVNLGLGIDAGVAFFKRKWGAVPFLKHCACIQQSSRTDAWLSLFDQLPRV